MSAAVAVGLCEMLATTPELSWDWAPGWLAAPVALVGFLAFLVLAGFMSLIGNAVVGLTMLVVLRRGCGWPLWQAALASAPYWIVFCRLVPKPW